MPDGEQRTRWPAVDVHAHVYLPQVERLVANAPGLAAANTLELRRTGQESTTINREMIGARLSMLTDLEVRMNTMTSAGIATQVLSVTPTQYHYWADRSLAWDVTQATNSGIATLRDRAPAHFTGLGAVPLQHPKDAVAGLQHALGECRLQGVEISTWAPGRPHTVELSDRRLDDFWHAAEQSKAVVLIHPWGCTLDERLDSWYLSNSVGQPVEHAVALSHLIFGGVLDRFPDLQIVASHGGGYLPAHMGRADHSWRVRPEVRCNELPSSYLRRIHFDTVVHGERELRTLLDVAGQERLLLGSDYPFDMGSSDPVGELVNYGLGEDALSAILARNATRLGLASCQPTDRTIG